jgi:hypothetical protein
MVAVRQTVTQRSARLVSLKGPEPREGVLGTCDASRSHVLRSGVTREAHRCDARACDRGSRSIAPRGHVAGVCCVVTRGDVSGAGVGSPRLRLERAQLSSDLPRGGTRWLSCPDVASAAEGQRDPMSGVCGCAACWAFARRPGEPASAGDSGVTCERILTERRGSTSRCERGIVGSSSDRLVRSREATAGRATPAGFGPAGEQPQVREAWARPSPRLMCAGLLVSTRASARVVRASWPQSVSDWEQPSGCEQPEALHTVGPNIWLRAGWLTGAAEVARAGCCGHTL